MDNRTLFSFWKLLTLRTVVLAVVGVYPAYAILSLHPAVTPLGINPLTLIGGLLILLGLFGYFWCVWQFSAGNQGDAPSVLVARGVYRWVRNPMYLSLIMILFGEGLLFGSWRLVGCALTMWFLIHILVMTYEEPQLVKRFGSSYDEYREQVPRWIPLRRP